MREKQYIAAAILAMSVVVPTLVQAEEKNPAPVRTIRLLQDDAQLRIASKLYELKYVKATDVRPYVEAAVKRYHAKSTVERVNYSAAQKNALIVSTGEDFIAYVDDLIAQIDRPGQADEFGSIIEGTGVTRIAYTPNYRAAEDIVRIINGALRSCEGVAYLNKDSNIIYWKDDKIAALATLAWVKYLDRPVPQVNLRLNLYEVRESTLRDVGVDYLAWKNGPGLNIFEVGYNGGNITSSESVLQIIGGASKFADTAKDFSSSWGYGGFLAAPEFDLSFVRLLQQSGNAKLISHADLTFVNTPVYDDLSLNVNRTYQITLTPDYQNIVKDADDRTHVVSSEQATLHLVINNPVICFGAETGEIDSLGKIPSNEAFYQKNNGGVVFEYILRSQSVVERNNRGDELGNYSRTAGALTLGFKTEKLLSSYVCQTNAEQTIGIPFLIKIPVLKYLFGTTTTIQERTHIILTAEANLVHPELLPPSAVSHEIIEQELN